jgi:hypothetical protein
MADQVLHEVDLIAPDVEAKNSSREVIQLRLPSTVLISPLWHIIRNGWPSGQAGKVLVEKRWW